VSLEKLVADAKKAKDLYDLLRDKTITITAIYATGGAGGGGGGTGPPAPPPDGFNAEGEAWAHGGMIREPTLMYGMASKRVYAIAGEAGPEPVGFPSVSITGNNFYVRQEADIDAIGREIVERIRTRTGIKF